MKSQMLHSLIEELSKQATKPETFKAAFDQALEFLKLLEELRDEEGASVLFVSDNADFNEHKNCVIVCCASWTDWEDARFEADTVLDCLRAGAELKKAVGEDHDRIPPTKPPVRAIVTVSGGVAEVGLEPDGMIVSIIDYDNLTGDDPAKAWAELEDWERAYIEGDDPRLAAKIKKLIEELAQESNPHEEAR